ncbi:response regulator transcription factor [Plantactinospora sp. B5E13]|uniref:response regulator transcription factor n=1 Tax=unclassified Plantactinospora TaxID=2631981 RepID=UPI00325DB66A
MTLRCLIVDDNTRFLDAARGLLERQAVTVVGVASTGADAVRQDSRLRPDVVLLDIDLGGESGFEVARQLRPEAEIIMVSAHAAEDYVDLVEASPAIGFLAKTALSGRAVRDLLDAHRRTDG